MKQLVVTFGQAHAHSVNGKTFDKDCVALINAPTIEEANRIAFDLFQGKFHQHVDRENWKEENMQYFPRGYIEVM